MSDNNLKLKFTLVKQDKEVRFMDAMKALKDKNKVYCILGDKKFDFYLHYNNAILDQEGCITIVQLLEGKWFIKA